MSGKEVCFLVILGISIFYQLQLTELKESMYSKTTKSALA